MTDFNAIIRNAIDAARNSGERFYTSEHMATVAMTFIPAAVAAEYEATFGIPIVRVVNKRAARG